MLIEIKPRRAARRRAFTLTELLVVIGLLTALASSLAAVYVAPSFRDNKNVIRGLDRVTTALLTARHRALRDQSPRGVRLLADAGGIVRELQLIEQPEAYAFGTIETVSPPTGAAVRRLTFSPDVDFFGGAPQAEPANFVVAPGDYFRCKSPAFAVRIQGVPARNQLDLPSHTPDMPAAPAANCWEVVRNPRPLSGEGKVSMPENVVLDMRLPADGGIVPVTNRVEPNAASPQAYDILFDPGGGVMNSAGATRVLWVRDATLENP
jgi:prepilin-type N-terminal cleavage/methylation domain-containing protein